MKLIAAIRALVARLRSGRPRDEGSVWRRMDVVRSDKGTVWTFADATHARNREDDRR